MTRYDAAQIRDFLLRLTLELREVTAGSAAHPELTEMIHQRIAGPMIRLLPMPNFDEGDLTEAEMELAFRAYWRDYQKRCRRHLLNLEALSDLFEAALHIAEANKWHEVRVRLSDWLPDE